MRGADQKGPEASLGAGYRGMCVLWKLTVYSGSVQFYLYCKVKSSVAQLCPTVCDPMDCNPPGSSVHGVLQARTLECVAIPFSKGSP